jgi:lipoyl(octanoyl) transferase
MRTFEVLDLGRLDWHAAFRIQQQFVEERKRCESCDRLLFVEHPHVVTLGRNAKAHHVLASPRVLERAGIDLVETDRGGDATYHGPGQLVGYPILDLREWRRDVRAYFRAIERLLVDALATLGVQASGSREPGYEGVWVGGAKLAAIGIHISRWITSHGFALNVDTDLSYFHYIVPCGLDKPVCSLRSLGCMAGRTEVQKAIAATFQYELAMAHQEV